MKIKISDKEKVIQFAIIFSNLNSTFEEVNLYFNTTGLYFQTTDSSLISMVELNIKAEWFDVYEIKVNQVFGINIECFNKILSCIDKDYTIEIKFKEKSDKINIILSDEKIIKEYEMNLMDIDTDIFDIPNTEYASDIVLDSPIFKEYITELTMFGEYLDFNCSENEIVLSTEGDFGKSKIIINEEYLEEYGIEEDTNIEQSFNIKYMKMVSNFVKLNKLTNIHVSDDKPLKIEYHLDNDENKITFFLAPKIKDD